LHELLIFAFSAYVPSIKQTKEELASRAERDYAELCRFGMSAEEIRALLGRVKELTEKGIGQVGVEDLPADELQQYVRELKKTNKQVS
jgi:hypothetical protein